MSELVDVVFGKEKKKRSLLNPSPPLSITPTFFFPLFPFLSLHFCTGFSVLCRRTEWGEETEEQSAAVWSSSCCLPDQRGNKRGLPGPTLLWRCLTDSQQLGPHSPPCRGHAAGLQGPGVTCPHRTGGKEWRRCWMGGQTEGEMSMFVSFVVGPAVALYSVTFGTVTV